MYKNMNKGKKSLEISSSLYKIYTPAAMLKIQT